jgi:hypothetical protein
MPLLEHHVPEQYPDLIVPKTQNAWFGEGLNGKMAEIMLGGWQPHIRRCGLRKKDVKLSHNKQRSNQLWSIYLGKTVNPRCCWKQIYLQKPRVGSGWVRVKTAHLFLMLNEFSSFRVNGVKAAFGKTNREQNKQQSRFLPLISY